MQTATGMVRIGGSLLHTVRKHGLTPAEIVVLRAVHGNDAVTQLRAERTPLKMKRNDEELERLELRYGGKVVREVCFPGHSPKLPKTFKEIGLNINAETKRTEAYEELARAEMQGDEEDDVSDEEMDEILGINDAGDKSGE